VIPAAGEIWLADRGEEQRRAVFVFSDARFHRLAERAVVAAILDAAPEGAWPWHVPLADGRAIAVNLLGAIPIERLLRRTDPADVAALLRARSVVQTLVS